jgi:ADP-ribose pyrophosphatase
MKLEEITLHKAYQFKGKVFQVRCDEALLPNQVVASREVIEHSGGVGIIALTDQQELLMVKQWRYPFGEILLEIPAGKLNMGELPLECAIRELKEETGARSNDIVLLGKMYPTPGYSNEVIYLYYATHLTIESQQLDQDEFLQLVKIPLHQALQMIISGEIIDAKTIIAIYHLEKWLKKETF